MLESFRCESLLAALDILIGYTKRLIFMGFGEQLAKSQAFIRWLHPFRFEHRILYTHRLSFEVEFFEDSTPVGSSGPTGQAR